MPYAHVFPVTPISSTPSWHQPLFPYGPPKPPEWAEQSLLQSMGGGGEGGGCEGGGGEGNGGGGLGDGGGELGGGEEGGE